MELIKANTMFEMEAPLRCGKRTSGHVYQEANLPPVPMSPERIVWTTLTTVQSTNWRNRMLLY